MMQKNPQRPEPGQGLHPDVVQGGPLLESQAYEQMRQELRKQLAVLQGQRDDISSQLQNPMLSGANRAGLSKRIENFDGRIASLDQQIAELDAALARASSVPGITIESPRDFSRNDPPEAYMPLGGLFILCVLLPISIAYARRIWRRGAPAVGAFPREISERLSRMDQSLDAIALEVERIGEGQRFLTRVYAEERQRAVSPGLAERIETPEREKERQRRGS